MVNNVDNKCFICGEEHHYEAFSAKEVIGLSRLYDMLTLAPVFAGSMIGDQNMMLAGMALYQANTGNGV